MRAVENPWLRQYVVYRCFGQNEVCLYVGQTKHFVARISTHKIHAPWAPALTKTRVTIHPSADVARLVEAEEIERLRPIFNKAQPNPQSPDEQERIGVTLRALRTTHGLTHSDVAEWLGVSRSFVANIEAGRKRLPRRLVRALAAMYNVNPVVLLTYAPSADIITFPTEASA